MGTVYNMDDYTKMYTDKYLPDKEKKDASINSIYDKQLASYDAIYKGVLNDENARYDEMERQNEIAKYINAEKVAENNANLGLTKSGLNLTQQTAVQLSASNNAASIARQRQSMVDSLEREIAALKADTETKRAADLMASDEDYRNKVEQSAFSHYTADQDYTNQQAKIAADKEVALAQAEYDYLTEQAKIAATSANTQKENNLKSFGAMIKSAIQKGDYASALQYYTTAGNMLNLDPYSGLMFLSDYAKLSDEDIDSLLGSTGTPATSTTNYQNLNYSDLGTIPLDILLDSQNWSLSSTGGTRGWFTGLDRNATAKFKLDNGKTYRMDEILWFLQNGVNKLGAADAKAKIKQFQQDIGATKK